MQKIILLALLLISAGPVSAGITTEFGELSEVCEMHPENGRVTVPPQHQNYILERFGGVNFEGCVAYLQMLVLTARYHEASNLVAPKKDTPIVINFHPPGATWTRSCRLIPRFSDYPTLPESLNWALEKNRSLKDALDKARAIYEHFYPNIEKLVEVECLAS